MVRDVLIVEAAGPWHLDGWLTALRHLQAEAGPCLASDHARPRWSSHDVGVPARLARHEVTGCEITDWESPA